MPAAAGTVRGVSPVWVFVVLETHFGLLLQMMNERWRATQLFSPVSNNGRLLDRERVERLLDGPSTSLPPCLEARTAQLVREAKPIIQESASVSKPEPNFGVASAPPFAIRSNVPVV